MNVNREPEDPTAASLDLIAGAALEAGRMLMESGASASNVETLVDSMARGLGADRVDLRIGYASLAITIGVGEARITRMHKVGAIGVNQQLDQKLRELARQVESGTLTPSDVAQQLKSLEKHTPRHSAIVMAVAAGLACAAFGRLLGVDWPGVGPVFLAAALGQFLRRGLASRHFNAFLNATVISFVGSVVAGLGARYASSQTVGTVMIAAILLLVPGVPALNAQNDILEGRPTLGSARAVWVAVILIFITVGLWLGQFVIAEGR